LNVHSASLNRLIISSTGLVTEKWFMSQSCAVWISASLWSFLPSMMI